jgi:hypothetical protein
MGSNRRYRTMCMGILSTRRTTKHRSRKNNCPLHCTIGAKRTTPTKNKDRLAYISIDIGIQQNAEQHAEDIEKEKSRIEQEDIAIEEKKKNYTKIER